MYLKTFTLVLFTCSIFVLSLKGQSSEELFASKLHGKWEVDKMDLNGIEGDIEWEPVDENQYNVYTFLPNNKFLFVQSRVDTLRGTYTIKSKNIVICIFETNVETRAKVEILSDKKSIVHLNYRPMKNQYDGKQYSLFLEKLN